MHLRNPDFFVGLDSEEVDKAIALGKKAFWEEFTKKSGIKGFAGGLELDHVVRDYLKQIKKKKLYIFDRRYGRLLQFLRGFHRGFYKSFIKNTGSKFRNITDQSFKKALLSLGPDVLKKAKEAGNKYLDEFLGE